MSYTLNDAARRPKTAGTPAMEGMSEIARNHKQQECQKHQN
jgi:hypothetical protein